MPITFLTNEDYVNLEEIHGNLEDLQTNDKSSLVAAINEAANEIVERSDLAADVQASLDKADTALQSYTETDPTVPAWAKAANKPTYTAGEVGADAAGTADGLVNSHNTNTSAHSDIRTLINNHASNKENPHGVTKAQIGLGNVDNTSDANKPISNAVQAALDGKANTSHGTHVTFGTTAPAAAGTASVGTATTVSRSDHVHPAQTSVSGNAGSADKLNTNAGSETQPVYFSNGVPVKTKYTLGADVPSDAKFTDTVYTLPAAGTSLGGVKTGGDVTISGGIVTVNDDSHAHVISNIDGLQSALDGKETSGAAASALSEAKSYTNTAIANLINSAPSTLDTLGEIATAMQENAGVVEALETAIGTKASTSDLTAHTGNTTVHITSTERTNWNSAKTHADSAHAPSNAEKNQNAFSKVTVGSTTVEADNATDTLTLVAGSNVTITPDATNDKITIAAKDTVYTHPSYTAKSAGLYKVTVDGTGHVSATTAVAKSDITVLGIPAQDTTYSEATTSAAGLMSASDKTKLNGIATGANKTTVDSELSSTSTNPVQNKVINTALAGKSDAGHTHDWNAAEGEPGYIENRTHYEGIGEVLLLDTSVTIKEGMLVKLGGFMPEIGKTYNVSFDGVRYENLTAFDDDGYVTIGEAYNIEADDYVWAEYPFMINDNGDRRRANISGQTAGDHTLQIYGEGTVIYKLDSKFIHTPDWNASEGEPGYIANRTHYTEGSLEVLFDGPCRQLQSNAAVPLLPAFSIQVGKTYTVTFDGVVYVCKCYLDGALGVPAIGAPCDSATYAYDFSEFPFTMAAYNGIQLLANVAGEHTVTIVDGVTHKLDAKYLPAPDWNASEGEDGYIENRTHYDGMGYVPLYGGVITAKTGAAHQLRPYFELIADRKYKLIVNDSTYELIAYVDARGRAALGAPFVSDDIGYDYSEYSFSVYTSSSSAKTYFNGVAGTYDIEIYGESETTYKLDKKYLHTPNWNASAEENGHIANRTHYCDVIENNVLFDRIVSVRSDGYTTEIPSVEILSGKTYRVYFDGSEYIVSSKEDENYGVLYIGAPCDENEEYDFTEYPFSLDEDGLLIIETEGVHTVRVSEVELVVHRLDEKYLPETVALKTDIPTIPTSLPANGGNADTVDGKHATDFATASHNHNSAYISKSLQFTADDGDAEINLASGSDKNLLTELAALGKGMHTFYSAMGNAGNPKTTEAWRGIVFKTGVNYGFVQAYGSSGSTYSTYIDGGTWRGWKCQYDANPSPLWTGGYYMNSPDGNPQTVVPSKKLSECRNGWLLLWSDYDVGGTINDSDFCTTMIPKYNPDGGIWEGKAFYCDIPMFVGSDENNLSTETRCIKPIYVHDNKLVGSYQNASGGRNDVVLRAVYEF